MTKPPLPSLPERLKKGAAFLGQLWAVPENRCPDGWTIDPCKCQPLKKFCQARNLWVTLALDDWIASLNRGEQNGREMDDGPFGLGLSMRASEWDACVRQMKIQHPDPDVGLINIGANKDCVAGMSYLAKMMDAPEGLASTLRVLKYFPNSKVQGVVPSEVIAPAAAVAVEAEMVPNLDEDFE